MPPPESSEHAAPRGDDIGCRRIVHRAHDLKNLLTVIAGCVDSLAGQLSEVQALSDLADLQRALGRAFLLASDLLGSEIPPAAQRSAINVHHAIADVEGLLRRTLGPAIRLRVSLLAAAPFVVAHPLDIERMLLNLILNAREAMANHGEVTIDTALLSMRTNTPSRSAGSRVFVRLTVGDTGPGLAPEAPTRARSEPPAAKRPYGRGFGLASVNETVQQLEGHLHIESQWGAGTRVSIDLPLASDTFPAQP